MAILLRDLYKETKSTYGLDLIAGEEGLDNLMNLGLIYQKIPAHWNSCTAVN